MSSDGVANWKPAWRRDGPGGPGEMHLLGIEQRSSASGISQVRLDGHTPSNVHHDSVVLESSGDMTGHLE